MRLGRTKLPSEAVLVALVGDAVRADLDGRPRGTFRYRDRGSLATIGRSRGVAALGRLHLSGFVAWVLWVFVHIWFLITFRNRMLVLVKWAWSWVTFERATRLIFQPRPDPDVMQKKPS